MSRFARYAWTVLAANVVVVLWGAVVRGTVSGAGCGQHWPKCNGQVLPPLQSTKTLIEYSHRISSGIALIMVLALAIWAARIRSQRPRVLRPALVSLALMISEALIGAGLVLLRLVELDASILRAVSMSLHLTNTFFLLGALTFTASAATFDTQPSFRSGPRLVLVGGLLLLLLTGITGAIAALGDTLFPAASLAQGLAQDASRSAHFLIRLRTIHPFFAVIAAVLLWFGTSRLAERAVHERLVRICRAFQIALFVQLAIGVTNLLLLVPLWTQLFHLLAADAVIISFALLAAHCLSPQALATD
jgi:heme A synthase